MKKFILIAMSILLFGCATSGFLTNKGPECIVSTTDMDVKEMTLANFCLNVKESGQKSYICDLALENVDPCIVHRGLEIVAKEGLVLDGYTADEFKKWAEIVKVRVRAGITMDNLKSLIMAEFIKVNRAAGTQVLILGDLFLDFPNEQILPPADVTLIVSSIDDLVAEVLSLDIWLN